MRRAALIFLCLLLGLRLGAAGGTEAAIPPSGMPRILTLLIEFQDLTFSSPDPVSRFGYMLNKVGYAEDGGRGSVRDYFRDNSQGTFDPIFDVEGPVRLANPVGFYGRDLVEGGVRQGDRGVELALVEACGLLDASLDFSHYDSNGDGLIDAILYYFPSYDQAAGAPSDRLWSQMGNIATSADPALREAVFDGVRCGYFICTSELAGSSGEEFCGIGLTCHEVGHLLGLPDLYDTDGSLNGHAGGPWQFSVMGLGCYNNGGRTPPYLGAEERMLLGWMDETDIQELPDGPMILSPIQRHAAYRSDTLTPGEYFLYECRNGEGWDDGLPGGVLIYHADHSQRQIDGIPAADLWNRWWQYNKLNNNASHPCFYAVVSSDPEQLAYSPALQPANIVFPGQSLRYCYEPIDWTGRYTGKQITNIRWQEGKPASLYIVSETGSHVNGLVMNSAEEPLKGVHLTLDGDPEGVYSDADGFFRIDLASGDIAPFYTLRASLEGFRTQQVVVQMGSGRMTSVPLTLRPEGEADQHSISKYDKNSNMGYYAPPGICAVRFTPEDLAPYVGNLLSQVELYPCVQESFQGTVQFTVDLGGRRILNRDISGFLPGLYRRHVVDLSDTDIVITEGTDLYIGYGPAGNASGFHVGTVYPAQPGNSYFSPFDVNTSHWTELYQEESGYAMDVILQVVMDEQAHTEQLEELGYSYIDPGSGSYHEGDFFPLKLRTPEGLIPVMQRWSFDGTVISDSQVLLSAGRHRVSVYLDYGDGRTEQLEMELNVN